MFEPFDLYSNRLPIASSSGHNDHAVIVGFRSFSLRSHIKLSCFIVIMPRQPSIYTHNAILA